MLFSWRKINCDNGAVHRVGPLEIPEQTYFVESVFIGFAVVAFRFVVAAGHINIDLLIRESKPEGHEIGITTSTVTVERMSPCLKTYSAKKVACVRN